MSKGFSEYDKEYQRKWREKNREHVRELNRASYQRNKEARLARERDKYHANPSYKEVKLSRTRSWVSEDRKKNRHKYTARDAKNRAKRLKRYVPWADNDAINFFYECCPEGCHVDHVIPLQGDNVSGFHIPENLQWLPAQANWSKHNGWEE